MAKKIITDFSLLEISAVDNPAQKGARATIMKRDDSIAESILKYVEPEDGAQSFSDVLEDTERRQEYWEAVEAVWPALDAMSDSVRSIVADDKMTIDAKRTMLVASVDDFLSAVVEKIPDAEQMLRKYLFDPHDAAKPDKEDEDDDMADIGKLEIKVNKSEIDEYVNSIKEQTDRADKAEAALDAFKAAEIEKNDETVSVNGQAIKKSAVGDVAFKALKTQSDEITKVKEDAAVAEFAKRAETELPNLPGDVTAKGSCLMAAEKMSKSDRATFSAMLNAGNKALGAAMKELGAAGDGADDKSMTKAEAKANRLADELVKTKGITKDAAMAEVWENTEIYNEYVAEKAAA